MTTPKKIRDKYTDDSFKSAEALEKFFRSGKKLTYDYVIVDGILYTMHEYDMEGRTVTWANEKHSMMLEVSTDDRYSAAGYTDARVAVYPASYLRNDITYAE